METNETILARKVVGLDDRKVLGSVSGLRIDCDSLAVAHYIVDSASTSTPLVLPLLSTLSVGDAFVTVQSREEFLGCGTAEERAIMKDGFEMLGVEVYSRTGNKLGTVRSYEFDPVFGSVERLVLDDGSAFDATNFVFFAPEFVFVDDGGKTAAELRIQTQVEEEAVPSCDKGLPDESPASNGEPDASDEDETALVEFLVGKTLADDVESADGAFAASKGALLTKDIVDEARLHGALLLLTISVEG